MRQCRLTPQASGHVRSPWARFNINNVAISSNGMQHEAILRTLVQGAGEVPDAKTVADAMLKTWHRMAMRLTPVIGTRGVEALFSRALHITSKDFPWLAVTVNDGNGAAILANLKVHLVAREADVALNASYTLLMTFTELLTTLIGESLTSRLLDPVWASSSAESERKRIS